MAGETQLFYKHETTDKPFAWHGRKTNLGVDMYECDLLQKCIQKKHSYAYVEVIFPPEKCK